MVAFSGAASAALLWWLTPNPLNEVAEAGRGIVGFYFHLLGWKEWITFIATAAIVSLPIFVLLRRSSIPQIAATLWTFPLVGSIAYATSLPDPKQLPDGDFIGPDVIIRWPLLSIGLQAGILAVSLIALRLPALAAQRKFLALATLISSLGLALVGWKFIRGGLEWLEF